jgi:hypothetical protein
MVAVPAATPVTTPVLPTAATPAALLLHTPPAVAFDKAVLLPAHTLAVPVMAPALGNALTVTTFVAYALLAPQNGKVTI